MSRSSCDTTLSAPQEDRDILRAFPILLRHYLERAAEAHGTNCPQLTPDAEGLLVEYSWPGNVRELKNIAERLVLGDWRRMIAADDLPFEVRANGQPAFVSVQTARDQRGVSSQRNADQ